MLAGLLLQLRFSWVDQDETCRGGDAVDATEVRFVANDAFEFSMGWGRGLPGSGGNRAPSHFFLETAKSYPAPGPLENSLRQLIPNNR